MKIRRLITICALLALLVCLFSCEKQDELPSDTTPPGSEEKTDELQETEREELEECPSPDDHEYAEESRVDALALKEGEIKYGCTKCKSEYTESIPATKSLKILALGNSFTDDSTWHLWNICKSAGVEEVIVGNLYVGNCTLDQHWSYISTSKNPYIYRKTTDGKRIDNENFRAVDALQDEDWDFIVLHQTSGSAGQASTYSKLSFIFKFIEAKATNPNVKVIWHMPWAYQGDSTHAEFPKYDRDQQKMYETIVARVQEIIIPEDKISAIIPSGTAIQNLRTSYVGDNVTRDGYHLNYGFGRYTAGLTWYAVLTGGDVDAPDWIPPEYPEVAAYLSAIREAVKGAMENNFSVTPSKIKTAEDGFDLSGYELLEWNYNKNGWWNCKDSLTITYPSSTNGTYNQNICTDRKYSIEELPVGTIFVCDYGWRVRIEQYPTENEKYEGARHGGCIYPFFVLSEEFLNGCTYVAWSVSSWPKTDISADFDAAYPHVRVYVPVN